MRIRHRISFASSPSLQKVLSSIGIAVAAEGFVSFEVGEEQETWPRVKQWVAESGALDFITTEFSQAEIAHASWVELVPDWHHGYPQPDEENFGYLKATYDLHDWCSVCGLGKRQKAPFQLKRAPRWGRRALMQLNWVFDEYFVRHDVWREVFLPHGIGSLPVFDKSGNELADVRQLLIEDEAVVATGSLDFSRCARCGRMKFVPSTRGPFPPLDLEPSRPIAHTRESFGTGAQADKRVLVHQSLVREMQSRDLKGAAFRPVRGSACLG